MKALFSLGFTVFSAILFSQNVLLGPEPTTRAVIIGISDYQNIDDLKYAHKDALAFTAYLQSPAGGNVPRENIRLLTNQKATMGAIGYEMGWLLKNSEKGDRVFIYYSGHGDVEAKLIGDPGYLLPYDSPQELYFSGAFSLDQFEKIIKTLSNRNQAQTIVITDACRAGKLAGSEIGGPQITAGNLATQVANEIKILSCQADEFSQEGPQWGGGRGVFSYHLIEGLVGLADKNLN